MSTSPTVALIQQQLTENPVILYMKGTADHPECGYSGAAVAALKKAGIVFSYVNVLQAPLIRERLPSISQWPTFPQLFVNGELVGGSDIVCAAVADGSLQTMVAKAADAQA